MSTTYINADLRRLVIARADNLCEYCLIHEDDTYFGCEVDHIISEKHGGPTNAVNLAYACMSCNRNKGSDVGSIVMPLARNIFSRFFNPRIDLWSEHFVLDNSDKITIVPLNDIGEVTVRILGFNSIERLLERQTLYEIDRYPTVQALQRIENQSDLSNQ
ncbi:HNH endonuclease [Aliterella atlantica]|uniref:HNH endonuclease n=1 Tax=Aliterella atlantica CENA595 TaxID=1618023 RepID=A0A0D8ZV52_9CYAN|nr:HNH endonuclease signature motif containing protein [Aliterella atlantica]KJH72663.1 HNH endonuclease [Aliterella atlantica CENA595]